MRELALENCRLDGRYDVQNKLGQGSYAEIYTARDIVTAQQSAHKLIVIKALNVFLQNDLDADLERTLVENFQNEAVALDRVRHPNIISRLGHGSARDLHNTVFHYLVLEYLSGGDLAKACRERNLTLTKALFYLEQVSAGLGHAHQNGIIHRDIKPQNLLLTEDRQTVKIADFGVARMSQSDSPITRVGTNMFAPPEHSPMISGDSETITTTELTPAADIYSLAKTAYVLITSESPRFFANQPIIELPFAFRQKSWAKILIEVLNKATQTDARKRHQTVNEFWQDLSRIKIYTEIDEEIPADEVKTRTHTIPQAHVAPGYTPLVPQRPQFNTSRELKLNNLVGANRAPLVVRLENSADNAISPTPKIAAPDIVQTPPEAQHQSPNYKKVLARRLITFVILLAAFAGILYGTHNYLRGRNLLPSFGSLFKSPPQGVALSDVNLRPSAGVDGDPIGLVPKNSKVKIVSTKDNWLEIDVVEFSRPKENSSDGEHGWVNKRYIDVQQ